MSSVLGLSNIYSPDDLSRRDRALIQTYAVKRQQSCSSLRDNDPKVWDCGLCPLLAVCPLTGLFMQVLMDSEENQENAL